MREFTIKKGLNIPLAGKPLPEVEAVPAGNICIIHPSSIPGIKARLVVAEGDFVHQGGELFAAKERPACKFRSPASGRIREIKLGPRRSITRVVIENADYSPVESFRKFTADEVLSVERDELLTHLLNTGGLALLRQRPFSKLPNPEIIPKSIFVNGMNTAPFTSDFSVVLAGNEADFTLGLSCLTRLTSGSVHLCLSDQDKHAGCENVETSFFSGPHPAGNTSVHISRLDPLQPGENIWTINATAVVLLGKLLREGFWPSQQLVALGGPGVIESACKHYSVFTGTPLSDFMVGRLKLGAQRVVAGDILAGSQKELDSGLCLGETGLTVISEDNSRHLMGWIAPGFKLYSHSRSFISNWLPRRVAWPLGTNVHGDLRPLILTGLYDRYLPLNIMTDQLVRAILAHETEEAIKLGILETAPEDFALCAFVCPSKLDLPGIIQAGLDEIEAEGIL